MDLDNESKPLKWSSQFTVATVRNPPIGDKILLPPSALEQLLAAAPIVDLDPDHRHTTSLDPYNSYASISAKQWRAQADNQQQQLPHPLTFRLVNPENGRAIYAGIREFSAEQDHVVLSDFLREALGIQANNEATSEAIGLDGDADMLQGLSRGVSAYYRIAIHYQHLPKGTYVKLRPLESGYDPEDWKALLEEHMRTNFTTLTNGEILLVYGGRGPSGKREEFRFLVDGFKPEGAGICVVDTDLEVDIEALNEEQARETMQKIIAKRQRAPGASEGSSVGGEINIFKAREDQVVGGEYVDYELPSWNRSQGLEVSLTAEDENDEIDVFVSPFSSRQRVRPRRDEYVLGDLTSQYPKRIQLSASNVEFEQAEAIWISVYAHPSESHSNSPKRFSLRVAVIEAPQIATNDHHSDEPANHPADEVQCKNCRQWVPKNSLFLHENFCLRNNILCPQGCGQVFQKRSETFKTHWHCPHDSFTGNTVVSHAKHDSIYHTAQQCPSCSTSFPSLPTLSFHRVTDCPGKLILCRFCHLQVPQEGDPTDLPNPELLLSGLTPHELADGGRTTECHLCNKIFRFRDMDTHLRHHDLERLSRPVPSVCRNINCGRTLDGANRLGDTRADTRRGQGPGNDIGLCSVCYGPLYVSMHDPEGKALRRRIERRYLSQLLSGCGKIWCRNKYCRTGRKNTDHEGDDRPIPTKEAIPLVKPFLQGVDGKGFDTPLHFCVDQGSQKRKVLAEMMAAETGIEGKGGYALEWCIAGLEAEAGDLDKARGWVKAWAPQRAEVS